MPELPEVQTTVNGVRAHARGLRITGVWTDYSSPSHVGKRNIKDKDYRDFFVKEVVGRTITDASRIGKNVLIHLSGGTTIVIHMKMTGHLLYGKYKRDGAGWVASEKGQLRDDPFNRFVHLVFSLSNGKHMALSDLRKFAKVCVLDTENLGEDADLKLTGPDPLSKDFSLKLFKERLLKRPNGKVKQVVMDPHIVAGIGNIYSDELLWRAGVHPSSIVSKIPDKDFGKMHKATIDVLTRGIDFGGDSMSDYRNILGEPGKFQLKHEAYRRTGKPCAKRGCGGTIQRIKMGGRSAHFCDTHQKLYK